MVDDAELVRAARNADVSAFTAIFDRYAARVHDLALAMLRDRTAALEVVESTFLEASLRLNGLEQAYRLPVWLLAVTRRNAALRASPTAGGDRQPSLPNDDPERVRLASLVWEAVADLPLRERTLIDLDLRQGLDGNDLADALGVTLSQAQDLQARMRDRIEKGLSGYVIAKTVEGRCPDLTKVLKGWDGRFTPKDSGRIARHVENCKTCNQIRFDLPSPFALYAAALPAPFPATVRPRVLEHVVLPEPPGWAPAMASVLYPDASEPAAMPYQQPAAPASSSFATAAPLPQAAPSPHDPAPVPWLDPFESLPPAAPPDFTFASQPTPAPPSFPEAVPVYEPAPAAEPAPTSNETVDPPTEAYPAVAPPPAPVDPPTEAYPATPPSPAPIDPPTEVHPAVAPPHPPADPPTEAHTTDAQPYPPADPQTEAHQAAPPLPTPVDPPAEAPPAEAPPAAPPPPAAVAEAAAPAGGGPGTVPKNDPAPPYDPAPPGDPAPPFEYDPPAAANDDVASAPGPVSVPAGDTAPDLHPSPSHTPERVAPTAGPPRSPAPPPAPRSEDPGSPPPAQPSQEEP